MIGHIEKQKNEKEVEQAISRNASTDQALTPQVQTAGPGGESETIRDKGHDAPHQSGEKR